MKIHVLTTTYLWEWPKSRTLRTPDVGEDVEQQELWFFAGGSANWYSHSEDKVWQFLTKTKHTVAVLYSNHTPLYPPKGVENLGLHKTCTWMFIAALFKAAKTWKQPRCLSVGEWISHL